MTSTNSSPPLRSVSLSEIHAFEPPTKKIFIEEDVETWRRTQSYQDLNVFLRRLNEAVVGIQLPWSSQSPSQAILSMITLIDTLDEWIDDIPPLDSPQRFGNLAFRTWGARLEERSDIVLAGLLPAEYSVLIPHLKPYFLTSFGSFTRMDYGTGHETSFAMFLLSLTLTRFLVPEVDEERELVLRVFVRYLRLCWRLQDVYRLEPAGSHGVWGLDDSHFLGYIFGSGQLRAQDEIPVSAVLRPPLPPSNLYFMMIMRIHEVKHGPFHEHSSQLHSIAVGVPNWTKVNSGLFKMYEAEVLGKRVVVQHIPLGGLLPWKDGSPHNSAQARTMPSDGTLYSGSAATQAPWAQTPNNRYNTNAIGSPVTLPPWSSGLPSSMSIPPRQSYKDVYSSSQASMPPPRSTSGGIRGFKDSQPPTG
ncbi:serine/threonine-protein phosphatase 2A activator 1 [Lentinula raphanica]|uniref:Serine/threonine-protein phosphatase 2A activator n=1 Tax=Lentinula raphanica TaxID=153919 RepID=A0AA38P8W1_9AGAR|nr:serine/threonine-protein phosphatase 2A activator 1 [Lentinula raphanica]